MDPFRLELPYLSSAEGRLRNSNQSNDSPDRYVCPDSHDNPHIALIFTIAFIYAKFQAVSSENCVLLGLRASWGAVPFFLFFFGQFLQILLQFW